MCTEAAQFSAYGLFSEHDSADYTFYSLIYDISDC